MPNLAKGMQVYLLPHDKIIPEPTGQPRTHFDEDDLEQLRVSIKKAGGIRIPITVRPSPDFETSGVYFIVAGERRWRCLGALGHTQVPAFIEHNIDDAFEWSLVENIVRTGLNPIEEAMAFQKLLNRGKTQQEVGEGIGKSGAHVNTRLPLLLLPDQMQEDIVAKSITPSLALLFVRRTRHKAKMMADYKELCARAHGASRLSSGLVKAYLEQKYGGGKPKPKPPPAPKPLPPSKDGDDEVSNVPLLIGRHAQDLHLALERITDLGSEGEFAEMWSSASEEQRASIVQLLRAVKYEIGRLDDRVRLFKIS